jgi:peroxiredoxin
MKNKNSLVIWLVAIVLVLTAASIVYSKYKPQVGVAQLPKEDPIESANTTQTTGTTEKTMAPDFSLKDLNGKTVKLSDYRGKIVILNFWTVWCKYCIQEMPDLNELDKELQKENDVIILAVNVQESTKKVKEYLDSNNISLKVLMDSDGAIAQSYGVNSYPITFIINRDGSLFKYIPGATDKETLVDILGKMG